VAQRARGSIAEARPAAAADPDQREKAFRDAIDVLIIGLSTSRP
jgi:hypothetical protein